MYCFCLSTWRQWRNIKMRYSISQERINRPRKYCLLCLFVYFYNAVPTCRAPPIPLSMRRIIPKTMKEEFRYGELIYYVCKWGFYRLKGLPFQKCGVRGWNRLTLECRREYGLEMKSFIERKLQNHLLICNGSLTDFQQRLAVTLRPLSMAKSSAMCTHSKVRSSTAVIRATDSWAQGIASARPTRHGANQYQDVKV